MRHYHISEKESENRLNISHIYAANHPRNRNEGDAGKRCPNHPDRYDIPRRFTVSQKESIVTCTFPACYPGNQQQYAKVNCNYREDDITIHSPVFN